MKNYRRRKTPLAWETRLRILALNEQGVSPSEIATQLSVDIAGVHRTIAWDRHRKVHQQINRDYRTQEQPK